MIVSSPNPSNISRNCSEIRAQSLAKLFTLSNLSNSSQSVAVPIVRSGSLSSARCARVNTFSSRVEEATALRSTTVVETGDLPTKTWTVIARWLS